MPNAQALFAAHREGVFRYLSRAVGHEDAPDLTQEVFLRVTRYGVPETTDAGERAWIFTIARHLALNHRRDTKRRPSTVELVETARPAGQETSVALEQALAQLADADREVFVLREIVGLSYDEIAASCAITVAAVRGRLHRSRQELRRLLRPLLSSAPNSR